MEAVQQLAPYQQQEFVKEMEKLQLKDSLTYDTRTNELAQSKAMSDIERMA
jgi:hypothetical protein